MKPNISVNFAVIYTAMSRILESCCTSLPQVLAACSGGASRIELCEHIEIGGVTPSEDNIRACVAAGLPVNVLVRPRGGNFVFTPQEEQCMLRDIDMCRETGAAGVVIGALMENGDVDMAMMRRLIARARGAEGERSLSVTFHRAFDECRDPFSALEDIISLGCDRLLTSGQEASAQEGMELISALVRRAEGRIIIMPGAGITPANLDLIEKTTGAVEFHGTRICSSK